MSPHIDLFHDSAGILAGETDTIRVCLFFYVKNETNRISIVR